MADDPYLSMARGYLATTTDSGEVGKPPIFPDVDSPSRVSRILGDAAAIFDRAHELHAGGSATAKLLPA